jgi:hypothetical protein
MLLEAGTELLMHCLQRVVIIARAFVVTFERTSIVARAFADRSFAAARE